jgi:glycosyltransferase involved in cell wall biosynthesis
MQEGSTDHLGAAGAGVIMLVAEEVADLPDEGHERFSHELAIALARRRRVVRHFTPKTAGHRWIASRVLVRLHSVWRAARRPDVKRLRPGVVLYASVNPASVPALIRARLLRRVVGAPVAMMVIQPNYYSTASRWLLKLLPPDLLLVGTDAECQEGRRLGVKSHVVWSGVDNQRFRPPEPGEKEELRRKYGLPLEDRIVLHVGHIRESRNLQALAPLAATPGVTVLLVASRRSWPESQQLRSELEAQGIRVRSGYEPGIEELYRLADCYVFPSTNADHAIALPLSVVEAIGSGLPVVAMRFRALPERLAAAPGVELVDTADELTRQVLAALRSPVDTRPLAAALSWDFVAEHILGLLEGLETGRKELASPGG